MRHEMSVIHIDERVAQVLALDYLDLASVLQDEAWHDSLCSHGFLHVHRLFLLLVYNMAFTRLNLVTVLRLKLSLTEKRRWAKRMVAAFSLHIVDN